MDWSMPLTSHLGFSPPHRRPQFLSTLGTPDPVAHAMYAAKIGMSGILYPWALDRSEDEVNAVRTVLLDRGLGCSAIVTVPSSENDTGIWCSTDVVSRRRLDAHVVRAAKIGNSLGATVLAAILTHSKAAQAGKVERDAVVENLARAAEIAADQGMVVGIEPMIRHPLSICRSTRAALDLVRRVEHRSIGIIYDTAHSAMMEGDILQALNEAFEHVVLMQLADEPGRVEPGAGILPLVEVVIEARRRGYHGLVDLEHHWLDSSADGERHGMETLRSFDMQVRERMAAAGMLPAQQW